MTLISISNMKTYIDQLLAVATDGIVEANYAFGTDRMSLLCGRCDIQKTFPMPESGTTISWEIQEFIKDHKAGHTKVKWEPVSSELLQKWGYTVNPSMMKSEPVPPSEISSSADGVWIDGKFVKWEKDTAGNIIGLDPSVRSKDARILPAPEPVNKPLRRATGRKFR